MRWRDNVWFMRKHQCFVKRLMDVQCFEQPMTARKKCGNGWEKSRRAEREVIFYDLALLGRQKVSYTIR